MKNYTVLACAASIFAGVSAFAGGPNAAYAPSAIDARLNVTVKDGTEVVHFVRDDATPNVITKAYEIKHVDPYELRNYLRGIVQTRRVNTKLTNVEAIKYTDGTALVLISAEDYRFNDTPTAQGFDSIVKELDKPKLVASSGRKTYIYSPKYRSSAEIQHLVNQVGIFGYTPDIDPQTGMPDMGNMGATDVTINDQGLNLIFFNTAPFSRKSIMEALAEYDQPYPEIRAKVTVYELNAENDTKLGFDFQAWKNNDGIDLFSAGGRFSQNYSNPTVSLASGGKWNDATYFNFNPKWNTKYLDFLTSKGKAKVVQTSELTLRNNETGRIAKKTQIFLARHSKDANDLLADLPVYDYEYAALPAGIDTVGTDWHNNAVNTGSADAIVIIRIGKGKDCKYYAITQSAAGAEFTDANGNNLGRKVSLRSLSNEVWNMINGGYPFVNRLLGTPAAQKTNIEPAGEDAFGFELTMTPSINTKATMLKINIKNSSLIGYTSDGAPRIAKDTEIKNEFMISNEGTKLVIGGLEKRNVMRVSGGVPILKDLPLIGWLFSTETEATKRSQLVVVAEVMPVNKADNYKETIDQAKKSLARAGESNTFGYRQFLIDGDRK